MTVPAVLSGLQNGTEYLVQVRAVNAVGVGPTVRVTATPSAAATVYTLALDVGSGGTLDRAPGARSYRSGTDVTLVATPQGRNRTSWSVSTVAAAIGTAEVSGTAETSECTSGGNRCTVTMTEDKTVRVTFRAPPPPPPPELFCSWTAQCLTGPPNRGSGQAATYLAAYLAAARWVQNNCGSGATGSVPMPIFVNCTNATEGDLETAGVLGSVLPCVAR